MVHECCAPGVESRREQVQSLPVSCFPWFWDQISRREVVSIPEVRDLPDEAAACREFLLGGKIRTLLAVPLASERSLWGYLGFVNTVQPARWSEDVVNLVRVLGEIFLVSLERKSAREQLETLNAKLRHASRQVLVGETSGAVYHQVRNVITSMGFTAGAAKRATKDHRFMEMMGDIEQWVAESGELLGEFLEFARTGESHRERFAPEAVVASARKLAWPSAKDNKVEILCDVAPDLPQLHCSRILVVQVFANLILNAVNALEDVEGRPRRVTVRVANGHEGYVEATVADNGPGIPPELHQAVFERFFTTRSDGVGLGLYISKSIVESHGGRLWMTSTPGEGTQFRFTLPVGEDQTTLTDD
jgi:signal transduction histidine kinase